ncbi:MAG: hypothetical protein ACYCZP_03855 [Acidimicrobiales bacterium]
MRKRTREGAEIDGVGVDAGTERAGGVGPHACSLPSARLLAALRVQRGPVA